MTVYTAGVWDLFHVGHLRFLKRVKKDCAKKQDFLIVGVSTDELIEEVKKKRPIIPFDQRWEIIESLGIANRIVMQDSYDKEVMQERLGFDTVYVGSDHWEFKEYEDKMKVIFFPHTSGVSTSEIYERIKNTV